MDHSHSTPESNDPSSEAERARIRAVYRAWHGGQGLAPYAWHRPEVMEQAAAQSRVIGALLAATVGPDLSALRVVDVGCGSGGFLRQLIGWGARPTNLTGTEYQEDRLDEARLATAPGLCWVLGDLDGIPDASVDLIAASTVFSSVLDEAARLALAAAMWRTLRPGGWLMIFDFRYNNPSNPNVRKVSRVELGRYWPAAQYHYRSLLLAPPIARRLAWAPRLLSDLLVTFAPPLRSHFVYICRKG